MSMISAQIDELREMVGDGSMEWVAGPVRASVLREAADTIWQLRDDLQLANAENAKLRVERDEWRRVAESKQDIIDHMRDARAENAKLREELEQWHRLTAGIELPEYPITEFKPKDLERENIKLRELVGELLDNLMPEICGKAWWCQDKNWHSCNDDACGNYTFMILANELGIEVDA